VRVLYAECRNGLGNRMKVLVAAGRVARATGRALAVGWPLDGYHLGCPLGRLFANHFVVLTPECFAGRRCDRYAVREGGPVFVRGDTDAEVLWVTDDNFFYLAGEDGVVWGQHGPHHMANAAVRDGLLAGFAALQVRPRLRRRIDEFAAARPVLGVHVRRGDNAWARSHVPAALFPAVVGPALAGLGPDAVLFLCSDDPAAEGLLREHFPGRVVTHPKHVSPLDRGTSAEAVEDALVEMCLLARTDRIVRTPSSTFSQCASWLGRVPTAEVGPHQHAW
jgi:hypothetical protein